MRTQFQTFERLAPRFRFGQVTMFHIDELHHLYGSDSIVLDAWRMIDDAVGRIMERADNVVLVSDHGSGPMKGFVNVVPALEAAGLLRARKDPWIAPLRAVHRLARIVPRPVREAVGDRRIFRKARDAVRSRTGPLHEWLPAASGQLRHRVDWSSPVVPVNQGLIFRNPGSKDAWSRDALIECVARLPGVARVWRREEIFSGPWTDAAPDLWIEAEPGIEFVSRFGEPWVWKPVERGQGWIVNHRPDGIFGFYGEDVEGGPITDARIYDMSPTILSLYGISPPPDVDGRTLPVWRARRAPKGRALPAAGRAG